MAAPQQAHRSLREDVTLPNTVRIATRKGDLRRQWGVQKGYRRLWEIRRGRRRGMSVRSTLGRGNDSDSGPEQLFCSPADIIKIYIEWDELPTWSFQG